MTRLTHACRASCVTGGLKDHPSEAVTMILIVVLFAYSIYNAAQMLKYTDTDIRKIH